MNRRQFVYSMLAPGIGSSSLEVIPGAVNGVILKRGQHKLAIYGDPRPEPAAVEQVLLTHARRDVCWAARGKAVIAPRGEAELISSPETFWARFNRFHDYAMVNTKVLAHGLPVERTVAGGDRIEWRGLLIEVLDTPGYSPGSVSYLFTVDDKRVVCPGGLIYGSGQLPDLYSLQDAAPEAKLRGYHGYAARAHELIGSLRRIAARKPDLLIPARGPVIDRPAEAIDRLIGRLKTVLAEHFKTDALRWYRGDDNLRLRARKLLEGGAPEWMPMAETRERPAWLLAIGNSRLILSESGGAFLVDCGPERVINEMKKLRSQGRFTALEGLFITHYHDDHTDRAQACADEFGCPVYFSAELKDILENPGAYRLPCLSPNPIRSGKPMPQGARQRWREFDLTYSYFPGQTLFHDSLLLRRGSGETILFAGDSFTPSGLDDYCLWNRNFLGSRNGFLRCLEDLRKLPPEHFLVNQHVDVMFRFSAAQMDFMEQSLKRRAEAMEQLFPWPDIDFGLDEQWARLAPYEISARPGEPFELRAVIWNHCRREQEYVVRPVLPAGWKPDRKEYRLRLPAQTEGAAVMRITPAAASGARAIVMADVAFGSWDLRQWAEAMVRMS